MTGHFEMMARVRPNPATHGRIIFGTGRGVEVSIGCQCRGVVDEFCKNVAMYVFFDMISFFRQTKLSCRYCFRYLCYLFYPRSLTLWLRLPRQIALASRVGHSRPAGFSYRV